MIRGAFFQLQPLAAARKTPYDNKPFRGIGATKKYADGIREGK
jgi:hypothetical protein